VGNKIDVGGRAPSKEEVDDFLNSNNLANYYETSAKKGEGTIELLNGIINSIDWSKMVKNLKPKITKIIEKEIKQLRSQIKIIETDELIRILASRDVNLDGFELKSMLKQFVSQNLIQFSKNEKFIVLDPEFVGKYESELIRIATGTNGIIEWNEIIRKWKFASQQLEFLFKYLENQKVCYKLQERSWIFSNVHRFTEYKIYEWIQRILDSDTKSMAYEIHGAGDFIFSRLLVSIAQELNAPEERGGFTSNTTALWIQGRAVTQTALLLQFFPSQTGGVIRFKTGGGEATFLLNQMDELANQIFIAYTSKFNKIPV
jgi:hypothetical protein